MSKITCDICMDLLPLVEDNVASDDSKQAVLEHTKTCKKCSESYNPDEIPIMNVKNVTNKIKKKLLYTAVAFIIIGVVFGISISAGEFMFYNVVIMPAIGAISYFALKNKSYLALIFVFVSVYIRWLCDILSYDLDGEILTAFTAPLLWAMIYSGLCAIGILIAFLLHFGFSKEKNDEKEN